MHRHSCQAKDHNKFPKLHYSYANRGNTPKSKMAKINDPTASRHSLPLLPVQLNIIIYYSKGTTTAAQLLQQYLTYYTINVFELVRKSFSTLNPIEYVKFILLYFRFRKRSGLEVLQYMRYRVLQMQMSIIWYADNQSYWTLGFSKQTQELQYLKQRQEYGLKSNPLFTAQLWFFKGAIYDIQPHQMSSSNSLLCRDIMG